MNGNQLRAPRTLFESTLFESTLFESTQFAPTRYRHRGCAALLLTLMLLAPGTPTRADTGADSASRVQQLIYGEALFHHLQADHFSAITRLQLAHEHGQLGLNPADVAVLVTRFKLAYGLRDEAETAFRTLLDDAVAEEVRNRAWYELAKGFFHQGQASASKRALDNVRGSVPTDIRGQHRLLLAHVLMALGLNAEAATELEHWQGAPALAGYARYNRGIALVRAGRLEQAIAPLQQVAKRVADDEELLALKDKANLTLGYAFIRLENLPQATNYLRQVRLQGPSSNRALLAMGWVAQQQGRAAEALVPWMALRERALADSAVQESLLAVPAAHRELQAPALAAQHYEEAVTLFSRELEQVNDAMHTLRDQAAADVFPDRTAGRPASPYLGSLLASRRFQQTIEDRADLRSMIKHLDQGLATVDRLAALTSEPNTAATAPAGQRAAGTSTAPPAKAASASGDRQSAALRRPHWQSRAADTEAADSTGGIPLLPEVELPAERQIRGFPKVFRGLPESEVIGFPKSEVIGFPDSELIGFPHSEIIGFPSAGIFRMPESADDFTYPDEIASDEYRRRPPAGSIRRIIRQDSASATTEGARDAALAELAKALAVSGERINRLIGRFQRGESRAGEMSGYLDALRQRMLQLREQIMVAIGRYQHFAHSLALEALQRRQRQLQVNLEQARLELAKSYDAAGAGYDRISDE